MWTTFHTITGAILLLVAFTMIESLFVAVPVGFIGFVSAVTGVERMIDPLF